MAVSLDRYAYPLLTRTFLISIVLAKLKESVDRLVKEKQECQSTIDVSVSFSRYKPREIDLQTKQQTLTGFYTTNTSPSFCQKYQSVVCVYDITKIVCSSYATRWTVLHETCHLSRLVSSREY